MKGRLRLKNLCTALFLFVGGVERATVMIACQHYQLKYPAYETSIGFATASILITGVISWVFLFGVFYPSTPNTSKAS